MTAVLPAHRRMRFAYPSHSPTIQRYFLDDSDIVSSSKCLPSRPPPSVTSSAPSSLSPSPNFTPTTLSNLSLDLSDPLDHEDILFPAYDTTPGAKEPDPPSDDSTASVPDPPRMNSQTPAVDDSALEEEPSRHVDYLSHEWEEEDIWASWRYVIARRNVYDNGARLENASWRTWAKVKLNRGTISPETLNW